MLKKGFFKFWWDQELDEFKCRSIASTRLWKDSGKPRTGPIFQTYRKDKSAYKAAIRNHRREATEIYTNDLHEALLNKEGNAFWKCWRSKFGQSRQAPRQVDGIVDPSSIADYFAEHFSRVCDGAACPESERLRSSLFMMKCDRTTVVCLLLMIML